MHRFCRWEDTCTLLWIIGRGICCILTALWWLILARYYFFLELATRLEYKAMQILATRFKYYKRLLNICNAFETLKTRFKYYKRVLNISNMLKHL